MKLYHGTSAKAARDAMAIGVKTRRSMGPDFHGNWAHTVKSNPDAVYLTVAYAPYFAMAQSVDECAVIELDSDSLLVDLLVPDEDAVEQSTRVKDGLPQHMTMEQRTKYYRRRMHEFTDGQWEASIRVLGNCAYMGNVPRSAITRIAFFNSRDNPSWAMACMDPTISILNYQLVGHKYRALTATLFDERLEPEPEHELQIRSLMPGYHNIWDTAKEFDHSKVVIEVLK